MKIIIIGIILLHSLLFATDASMVLSEEEKNYLHQHPTIKACINPAWMPFEVLTPDGKYEGIAADLLKLVIQRVGLNLEIIQTYTWEESLEKARKKQCDIINFINKTAEYEKWLLFSEPLFSDPNVLITREEHPYIHDPKELLHESIAISKGDSLLERFSNEFPNMITFSVAKQEDAILMVSEKRVDMTIHSLMVAAHTIKKGGFFNLKIAGMPQNFTNYFRIGITNNNPLLQSILNKGVESISALEKDRIINNHVPIIIQPGMDQKMWYVVAVIMLSIGLILLWNYTLRQRVKEALDINLSNQKIMMQQTKKAELGELIGNISHQWREPLSNLSSINLMMIGLLEHHKEINKDFLYQKLKNIENTLDFMSQTMQNFLEFYKPSIIQKEFNIFDSIQQALSIVETNIISYDIRIEFVGDKDAILFGIKNEYMQVWLILINNAINAFKQSGVETKIITITIGEKSEIKFCDNARGTIEPSDYTKGVGLLMCKQILGKYGKTLVLKNMPMGVCAIIH